MTDNINDFVFSSIGEFHPYLYSSSNPINESDPQGLFEFAITLSTVSVSDIAATAVLSAGIYCALAQATTFFIGILGGDLSIIQGIPPECVANQMRVQLQANTPSSRNTLSVISVNTPEIGVTVLQVRTSLSQLFLRWENDDPKGLFFPKTYRSDLIQAIVRMSADIGRFPPDGIDVQNFNVDRENIPNDNAPKFRLDLENVRGHNLRS